MGAAVPFLTTIAPFIGPASTLLGGLLGGGAPEPAAAPPPPAVAKAPEAPEVAQVEDVEPVVDVDAARRRAASRRATAEKTRLFALSPSDDETVVLTKSLLGE